MKGNQYTDSIKLAQSICEVLAKVKAQLPYNINVIDELHADENAHSRILCKLLQYRDTQKHYRILESLLNYIPDNKGKASFGDIHIQEPVITQEEERIDLWIRDKKGGYVIIFENKVKGANDQDSQLMRYIEKTKDKGFKEEQIFIIYMPADTHEPDENSWGEYKEMFQERYVNLSYEKDILPWLKEDVLLHCTIKEVQLVAALRQYIDHLEGLFGLRDSQKKQYNMTIQKLLDDQGKNSLDGVNEILKQIEEAKKSVCNYREDKFFKPFLDRFDRITLEIWGEGWEINNRAIKGKYYQLRPHSWPKEIHLEWNPMDLGCEDREYNFCMHVEGSENKPIFYRISNDEHVNTLCEKNGYIYKQGSLPTPFLKKFKAPKPLIQLNETELNEFILTVHDDEDVQLMTKIVMEYLQNM